MGAISRGWELTKQSWAVLKNDRSLVIFPILSAIFATGQAPAAFDARLVQTAFGASTRRA